MFFLIRFTINICCLYTAIIVPSSVQSSQLHPKPAVSPLHQIRTRQTGAESDFLPTILPCHEKTQKRSLQLGSVRGGIQHICGTSESPVALFERPSRHHYTAFHARSRSLLKTRSIYRVRESQYSKSLFLMLHKVENKARKHLRT